MLIGLIMAASAVSITGQVDDDLPHPPSGRRPGSNPCGFRSSFPCCCATDCNCATFRRPCISVYSPYLERSVTLLRRQGTPSSPNAEDRPLSRQSRPGPLLLVSCFRFRDCGLFRRQSECLDRFRHRVPMRNRTSSVATAMPLAITTPMGRQLRTTAFSFNARQHGGERKGESRQPPDGWATPLRNQRYSRRAPSLLERAKYVHDTDHSQRRGNGCSSYQQASRGPPRQIPRQRRARDHTKRHQGKETGAEQCVTDLYSDRIPVPLALSTLTHEGSLTQSAGRSEQATVVIGPMEGPTIRPQGWGRQSGIPSGTKYSSMRPGPCPARPHNQQ